MTEVLEEIEQAPLVVHPIPSHRMDDEEFFEFCQLNGDLRIERSAEGDIILMAQPVEIVDETTQTLRSSLAFGQSVMEQEQFSIHRPALSFLTARSARQTCRGF
jgi:hypothetical protein